MIDELVRYKNSRYSSDQRRILTCGILEGKIRVEWLPAAAPNVDSHWEMKLYGLVRSGDRARAIRHLQMTKKMSRHQAAKRVARNVRLIHAGRGARVRFVRGIVMSGPP